MRLMTVTILTLALFTNYANAKSGCAAQLKAKRSTRSFTAPAVMRKKSMRLLRVLDEIRFLRFTSTGSFYPTRFAARQRDDLYVGTVDPVSLFRLEGASFHLDIRYTNNSSDGLLPKWREARRAVLSILPKGSRNFKKIQLQQIATVSIRRQITRYIVFAGDFITTDGVRKTITLKMLQVKEDATTEQAAGWHYSGIGVFTISNQI